MENEGISRMKKPTLKRFGLGFMQHIFAAGIMLAAAVLLLNSYIAVNSIDGTQIYKIFPVDVGLEFEESEMYHDLFRNAVSDITQLVVIKRHLETDGVFDPSKEIDVTAYAREIGADKGCSISAVYELDNIIKWGKNGVEYTNRFLSMSDFVNYFGYCIYPENFKLDEHGQLSFDAFYRLEHMEEGAFAQQEPSAEGDSEHSTQPEESDSSLRPENVAVSGKSQEEIALLAEKLNASTTEQLEDLVFSHIMSKNPNHIDVSREDDGTLVVYVPLLNCRYATTEGERQLTKYADNWMDYMQLQDNVAAVIEDIQESYQRYQICNDAYKEENSNVKYMVRMMTDTGMCTYTNRADLEEAEDDYVTESFNEYRWYLIYYPDSLVFMGNTILSEEEIDGYISTYGYAYPDTTHIWLGVDSSYAIEEDAFYEANALYQKIVPNINRIIGLIFFLAAAWVILGIYLTVTAGVAVSEKGEQIWYLNRFDRVWTELIFLLAAAFGFGGIHGYHKLMDIVGSVNSVPQVLGIPLNNLYRYGLFALYGLYVSIAFNLVWYSLTRRIKANNLWRDSFIHFFCRGVENSLRFIFHHKNSVVSTLLPYNVFLFSNLAAIMTVYTLRDRPMYMLFLALFMVVADGIVGVLIFRRNGEMSEIVEGIKRIRDGEVDFKLDSDSLHGSSRELADAVNNIGEGIRKAVNTSMKDEQMKTDLITNVSHDIKTPLTSIINYVDLLKRLNIPEEPAKKYIDILDGKTQRLKQLTDDLVEASKISSGNIELEMEKLNLTELVNQGIGEFSEKMEECRLQIVFEETDSPAYIYADSRRMWRVMENLFNNVCKYALEGTRVYIDITKGASIEVSIKNISRQQMNVRSDELTERFIRGDSSRTTEGSGLGLYIARSLVQVQGGSFELYLDGDLFKTVFSFPEYNPSLEEHPDSDTIEGGHSMQGGHSMEPESTETLKDNRKRNR